jgi:hypothetical protein
MGAGDGASGAATIALAWFFFSFFFQNAITCVKMWINRLWINAIRWIMDKWI